PSDERDVAIKVPRRLADHRVKLAARTGIGRQVTPDADAGVTMGKIGPTVLGAVGDRPAAGEARARRIGVRIAERLDAEPLQGSRIFGRRLGRDTLGPRLAAIVLAPLRDIIVLHPIDARATPIIAPRQRLDVGDVYRGEGGRELDDHPSAVSEV